MYTLVLTDLHIYGILKMKKISETLQTVPEAQKVIVIPMSTSYLLQYFLFVYVHLYIIYYWFYFIQNATYSVFIH